MEDLTKEVRKGEILPRFLLLVNLN